MRGVERYAQLLRTPHVGPTMVAALLARLPIGILGLALVLFVRAETGSYASAGAVAAASAIGTAAGALVASRLVDRVGVARVLVPMVLIHVTGTVLVVVLGTVGSPVALLIAAGGLAGAAVPPISSVVRTLLPVLLADREELEDAAFALDAVSVELVFVGGPALVALLNVAISPAAPLLVSCALALIGTTLFVARAGAVPDAAETRRGPVGPFDVLRARGLQTLLLGMLPIGFALGATEVILPAFSEDVNSRALGGVLLAVWSVGSVLGGVAYGAHSFTLALADRFVRLAALLPLTFVPLAVAPSFAVMLVLVVPAGAIIAPTLATGTQLVGSVTPPAGRTEAYAWPLTALVLGVATGNACAGAIVEAADWQVAFLAAIAVSVAGSLLLATRRPSLLPVAPAAA